MVRPPRLPRLLLRLLLRGSDYHEFIDDLNEVHARLYASKSRARASRWYWLRTLESIPSILFDKLIWRAAMLKNSFKVALRHILRHKGYSLINIVGLAVGMACCILIYIYVSYELSFDRHHPDSHRIFRVRNYVKIADKEFQTEVASKPMASALRLDYPEVQHACAMGLRPNFLLEVDDEQFNEENLLYVEDDFFKIFALTFLKGGPQGITGRPNTIMMTDEAAKKYFGPADPLGKRIRIGNRPYEVTGVFQTLPSNSHLRYHFLTSMLNYWTAADEGTSWGNLSAQVFIKLKPGIDGAGFAEKIRWIVHQQSSLDERGWSFETILEPISRIHLHSKADAGNSPLMVYAVSIIGLLIMLIACLNFINLTTARASTRAREVGVRKVAGARRSQLIQQFLGESLALTFAAFVLSVLIAVLTIPTFNHLIERKFSAGGLIQPAALLFMLLLVFLIGSLAGSYPAFIISRHEPVTVLANRSSGGMRRPFLRRAFVIIQFTVTTVLIVSTLTVFNQIHFMKNKSLGFNQEQKLILPARLSNNNEAVKSRFLNHPNIVGAAASSSPLGQIQSQLLTRRVDAADHEAVIHSVVVDADFIPEYGIRMAAGRAFSGSISTDQTEALILNRTAAVLFGWNSPEEAVGKILELGQKGSGDTKTIIGVTEDFHFQGLQQRIGPLRMICRPEIIRFRTLSLTVKAENLKQTLAYVKETWNELRLGDIYTYSFLDRNFDRLYAAEERVRGIFTTFALLAVSLSCLGLFGLSAFITTRRTKEIGIRKVLGASVPGILRLISREFVLLLAAANLIAWPLAWLAMSSWLSNFAYRIDLSWTIFALSTVAGLGAAMASVTWQSLRAARADPVDSLRCE